MKKKFFQKSTRIVLLASALVVLASCSTGDSNDNKEGSVADIALNDSTIQVGDDTRVDVLLTYASDRIFNEDSNLIVKVLLPAGISYRSGSARVEGTPDDDVNPESVAFCLNGSTVLTFDLDSKDLDTADNAPGAADATLQLDVRATGSLGGANIDGRAGYDFVSGDCESLIPQATAILFVQP